MENERIGWGNGPGWGASGKPLPKWLTDAGCTFAINVDRQVKALANPNSPFINPLVDVVGKLGKNLFDSTKFIQGGVVNDGSLIASTTRVRIEYLKVLPNTTYTLSVPVAFKPRLIHGYNSSKVPTNLYHDTSSNQNVTFTTGANDDTVCISIMKADGVSTITPVETINAQIQLEPGTVATTYEPYGFNNVLLQSFAGTTADGYTQIALPNGKNPWFLKFDGTDSLGIMANTADVDILGTNDFAISCVFRTPATLVSGYIISKGGGGPYTDQQYAVTTELDGRIYLFLNGTIVSITSVGAIVPNTLYELLIIRVSGVLNGKLNKAQTYNLANTTNVLTKPNLRIGARSANAEGTTYVTYVNINLGNLAIFYNGATGLDIAKVEKAVAKFNANYI